MSIRKKCYNMMKERMAPYGFTRCTYEQDQYCKVAKGGWLSYQVMATYHSGHNYFSFQPYVGFRSNVYNALQADYFSDNTDMYRRICPERHYPDKSPAEIARIRREITRRFDHSIRIDVITGWGYTDISKLVYVWEEERVPEVVDFYMDLFTTYGIPFLSKVKSVEDLERLFNEPMVSLSSGQLITEEHPVLGREFNAWEGILLAYIAKREAYEVIQEAYMPFIDSMIKTTFAYGRYLKLFDLLKTEEFRERTDQLIKKYGSVMPTIDGV